MPDSAIRHQNALPSEKGKVTICDGKPGDEDRPKKSSVCKSIDGCQEELLAQVVRKILYFYNFYYLCVYVFVYLIIVLNIYHCTMWSLKVCPLSQQISSSTAAVILEMLMFLMEAIQTNFQQTSAVGSSSRAQKALNELHTQDKAVEMTDQLMVLVLYFFLIQQKNADAM